MWHVSSRSGVATSRTAVHSLLTDNVGEEELGGVLAVVPVTVVNQQLHQCPVYLHKDRTRLVQWVQWTDHVGEEELGGVLAVVPVTVVNQQLHQRPVYLHKDRTRLVEWVQWTDHVGEEELGGVLAVVPVTVVDPLTQQLDGRLRAVLLLGRHVEVVDERDALLAERRPVHTLATPRRQANVTTVSRHIIYHIICTRLTCAARERPLS